MTAARARRLGAASPGAAGTPDGNDSDGVVALVFGVLGLVALPFCLVATMVYGYPAVAVDVVLLAAAVVFGKRGVDQTRRDPTRRGRGRAIAGLWLGITGGALWAAILALALIGDSGGPDRREPTTPEQLAVTTSIRTLFAALAADDPALACAQLTAGAQAASTPVLRGSVGWLRCRGEPAYRGEPVGEDVGARGIYNVTITGNRAEAEMPFGSDRYSNGWRFVLVRAGGRWLIADASVYSFSGG